MTDLAEADTAFATSIAKFTEAVSTLSVRLDGLARQVEDHLQAGNPQHRNLYAAFLAHPFKTMAGVIALASMLYLGLVSGYFETVAQYLRALF